MLAGGQNGDNSLKKNRWPKEIGEFENRLTSEALVFQDANMLCRIQ